MLYSSTLSALAAAVTAAENAGCIVGSLVTDLSPIRIGETARFEVDLREAPQDGPCDPVEGMYVYIRRFGVSQFDFTTIYF